MARCTEFAMLQPPLCVKWLYVYYQDGRIASLLRRPGVRDTLITDPARLKFRAYAAVLDGVGRSIGTALASLLKFHAR